MVTKTKQPGWLFNSAWIVLSTIATPLAFSVSLIILSLITRWIGDWIYIDGRRHITEDYLLAFVFVPLIWLFSSGLQYILLRLCLYWPKMGWWVMLTAVGWLLTVVTLYLLSLTLPKYFATNSFNIFILPIIGTSIGFSQWLLLRRRVSHAFWWIIASALGWSMIALVGLPFTNTLDTLAIGFFPSITTAFVWWLFFRQQPQAVSAVI